MPNWNPMQLKAIQTKDKNILVSASAGSGKTTVLIARLMDLVLKDRIPIEAILAMTFTEAAANEMKKRLAASLQDAYQVCDDEDEKIFINKQLTNIQTAHISTIHSFCLSIIQKYYYRIALDPRRIDNILDSGRMMMFQQQALKDVFQVQYKLQDPIFHNLCQMFSTRAESDEALSNMIKNLATLASSKPAPEEWLHSITRMYQDITHINDLPPIVKHDFFEFLYVEVSRYEDTLRGLFELYQVQYPEEIKKSAIVKSKIEALPSLYTPLKEEKYYPFCIHFQAIVHATIPTSPDKEDKEYVRLRRLSQDLEDRLLAILYDEHSFMKDIKEVYPYIQKLVAMCFDYRKGYATIKEEQKVIDFDDMEHFALDILQAKQGQVAALYRKQFVEIMVDEFQDSNDVQNKLVMLICRDNNVFRVGDIKQSIYGFRHAKPQLMQNLIKERTPQDEVLYLSNNYRSKKMIVDFNNELFKQLMNIDGFSCSYTEEDDVETGVAIQNQENVPICFHAIYHNEIKEKNNLLLSKNDFKASYIANQIMKIKEDEQRNWKDFVVLVRSNARKENLKEIFDELHIPYFIDVKSGFYQSNSVQIVLSTLQALVHPNEDIPFIACMLSPLFQQSAMDIATAKLHKEKHQSYYAYFKEHPFSTFSDFENLREQLKTVSLCEILNLIFNQNQYYALHTTIQEKTNLDLLFEKGVDCEQQSYGIHSFLSQIDQIKDIQSAEAIPIGSEANVVRVMSIHQSKGLQFPVVFLWSTDKMQPVEFKDFCICDEELGIAIKFMQLPQRTIRTTPYRIAMEHKKDREELEEEMRILYVATTRAQQQMHIVDCIASLEPYKHPLSLTSVYQRGGYTSWILQAFLNKKSDLFELKEVHTYWENESITKVRESTKLHPIYQLETTKLQLSTPTSMKKKDITLPSLTDSQASTTYGTKMHKMIELLSDKEWSHEHILQMAKQYGFSLLDSDIKTLQQLKSDPLFKEALQEECYYELPFMIKDKDEILHGILDFVSIADHAITIIDFKTDALQDEQLFIERYKEQLDSYQRAMNLLYPNRSSTCYIYSLHLHKMILLP